jgi:hypothetical protein
MYQTYNRAPEFSWRKLLFQPQWRIFFLAVLALISMCCAITISLLVYDVPHSSLSYLFVILFQCGRIFDYRIYTHPWLSIILAVSESSYWSGASLFSFHLFDTYERGTLSNKSKIARGADNRLFLYSTVQPLMSHFDRFGQGCPYRWHSLRLCASCWNFYYLLRQRRCVHETLWIFCGFHNADFNDQPIHWWLYDCTACQQGTFCD